MKEDITYVVSKDVGGISQAWKIVKIKFPTEKIGRYTKDYTYDGHGSMLFHDINYYFQIILAVDELPTNTSVSKEKVNTS